MKKTFDFDFGNGEFVIKDGNPVILSGINALKLWIQKCMRTQLYIYSIYKDKQYGANIEDLVIGKLYNFDSTLIVGTISLFASFLGAITGLSNYNYNKDIEETIES